ncbi:MAG: glycosyltransferase [Patescibacteria group bacterium]|jgi:glycosyltransferase involved in cell wall biosynthesis
MKILIAIPAYNEESILEKSVLKLLAFCQQNLSDDWQIIIADNNSKDRTSVIGKDLAAKFPAVKYLFVSQKGKGVAIKTAWRQDSADIYCFMDADLATDLAALPQLISGIKEGNDLVIGSRFHPKSKVVRSLGRKLTSQAYRLVLKIILALKINDAPCGFKAINQKVKENLLDLINNQQWFFDSELVILAEKKGYKIKEIPISWQDPREGTDKSRVNMLALSWNYFKEVLALRKRIKSQ